METYRYETTLTRPGILTLTGLPFRVGERIEVIVHSHSKKDEQDKRYPLRGQPIEYIDPFSSVSEEEWEVLQ